MSTELKLFDNPFNGKNPKIYSLSVGTRLVFEIAATLADNGISKGLLLRSCITVNGNMIERSEWGTAVIKDGDDIHVYAYTYGGGDGGKGGILQAIVGVALIIIGAVASYFGAGIGTPLMKIGVGMLIGGIASMLAPAPQKPKMPSMDSGSDMLTNQVYTTTGASNQYRPFQPLPVVIGKIRSVPDKCVADYQVISGNEQCVRQMFCITAGDAELWDLKAGTTPIADLGVKYKIHRNWKGNKFQFFDNRMQVENANFNLKEGNTFKRTSTKNVISCNTVVYFHAGLYRFDKKDGKTSDYEVEIHFYFTGKTTGKKIDFIEKVSWGKRDVLRKMYSHNLPNNDEWMLDISEKRRISPAAYCTNWIEGGWKEIGGEGYVSEYVQPYCAGEWVTPESYTENIKNYEDDDILVTCEAHVTEVQFVVDEPVMRPTKYGKTLVEIEFQASDKLSGAIGNFNCMAKRMGKRWDGKKLVNADTSNISAQALSLLTDSELIAEIASIPINYESFSNFYSHCEKYGWHANLIETQGRQLGVVLSEMCNAGDGYLQTAGGIISIYYDSPEREYVDVVTPRNSWDAKITMQKPVRKVEGVRFLFNNEEYDYQQDEITIYADGFDRNNALNIFSDTLKCITNWETAWKRGRLWLANMELRNALFNFSTDWRSIGYDLGDKIRFSNHLCYIGVGSGKIIDFELNSNGYATAIWIDQYLALSASKSYTARSAIRNRVSDWEIKQSFDETTNRLVMRVPIPSASIPPLYSEISVGETSKDTKEVLIRRIDRQQDFVASIEAIPASPEYLQAIDGPIPPYQGYLTEPSYFDQGEPYAPVILAYAADESVATLNKNKEIVLNISLSLYNKPKSGINWGAYLVTWRKDGDSEYSRIRWTQNDYSAVIDNVQQGAWYDITVYTVSAGGIISKGSSTRAYVSGLKNKPPSPTSLYVSGKKLMIELEDRPIDFFGFEVLMTFDAQDTFNMARVISNPLNVDGVFDISSYYDTMRRAWVRTVDKLGLKSEPISILIGAGDKVQNNIVEEFSEQNRKWAGVLYDGVLINKDIIESKVDSAIIWDGNNVFPLWDGKTVFQLMPEKPSKKMVYEYSIGVAKILVGARLDIYPVMIQGEVERIEIAEEVVDEWAIWDGSNVWTIWDGSTITNIYHKKISNYFTLPNNYIVQNHDNNIHVRVTFKDNVVAKCDDILTIFDVPDSVPITNQRCFVPESGLFVQVPDKYFRHISSVSIDMRYEQDHPQYQAYTGKATFWGTYVDGWIVDGVVVKCFDASGAPAKGLCDITIRGY